LVDFTDPVHGPVYLKCPRSKHIPCIIRRFAHALRSVIALGCCQGLAVVQTTLLASESNGGDQGVRPCE
jgi:hypothetical protein